MDQHIWHRPHCCQWPRTDWVYAVNAGCCGVQHVIDWWRDWISRCRQGQEEKWNSGKPLLHHICSWRYCSKVLWAPQLLFCVSLPPFFLNHVLYYLWMNCGFVVVWQLCFEMLPWAISLWSVLLLKCLLRFLNEWTWVPLVPAVVVRGCSRHHLCQTVCLWLSHSRCTNASSTSEGSNVVVL